MVCYNGMAEQLAEARVYAVPAGSAVAAAKLRKRTHFWTDNGKNNIWRIL